MAGESFGVVALCSLKRCGWFALASWRLSARRTSTWRIVGDKSPNSADEITRNRSAYWLLTRSRASVEFASSVKVPSLRRLTRSGLIQWRHAASPISLRMRWLTRPQQANTLASSLLSGILLSEIWESCVSGTATASGLLNISPDMNRASTTFAFIFTLVVVRPFAIAIPETRFKVIQRLPIFWS